jgi:hypothetical protein
MSEPLVCRECELLKARLKADSRVYVIAARRLEDAVGSDFEAAYQDAERAREAYEDAKIRFEVHAGTHMNQAAGA